MEARSGLAAHPALLVHGGGGLRREMEDIEDNGMVDMDDMVFCSCFEGFAHVC